MFSVENNILEFVRQFCDYDKKKVSKRILTKNNKNTGSHQVKMPIQNSLISYFNPEHKLCT